MSAAFATVGEYAYGPKCAKIAGVLPSIDGLRIVQVEVLTRDFSVRQAALFIEHLYAFGSEAGVTWSERFTAPEVEHA